MPNFKKNNLNEESIYLLNRVRLVMKYDPKKTLNENKDSMKSLTLEQEDNSKKEFDNNYILAKLPKQIGTPSGIIIPRTKNVTFFQEGDNPVNYFFKKWFNTEWDKFIPDKKYFNSKFPPQTLRSFQTPDGKFYTIRVKREDDKESGIPNLWNFLWYYDEDEKPYSQKDYVTTPIPNEYIEPTKFWDKFVDYWKNNWSEWLWVIAAVIVGMLTEGAGFALIGAEGASATALTILGRQITWKALWRYLGEAAVWSTKGLINLAEGHSKDASIDFIFGFLLPAVHGLGINKWGITATEEVAEGLALKLVGKSSQEVSELLTKSVAEGGLSNSEKQLFKQLVTMAPESVKAQTIAVLREINNRLIAEGKNPISLAEKTGLIAKGAFQEIGRFVQKRWYTSLPAYLAHDYFFLKGFDKICEYFGILEPDNEWLQFWTETYEKLSEEDKKIFDKMIDEGLKNSKTIGDLNMYYQNSNFLFDTTQAKKFDTIAIKKKLNIKD